MLQVDDIHVRSVDVLGRPDIGLDLFSVYLKPDHVRVVVVAPSVIDRHDRGRPCRIEPGDRAD